MKRSRILLLLAWIIVVPYIAVRAAIDAAREVFTEWRIGP